MGYHRLATPDLERIFRGETVHGLSEWQLLERYLENRDEVAFEALVARHGPMVLGVCRRMLANQADVEDAFQATFLVLVRRARHLGPRDAIGPWLYGVANRVAMRARSDAARRNRFEPITPAVAPAVDDRSAADREIAELLDQELSRLPSKYRHPIVLCYLEGQTHEEAARQLKWPIGTVKGRLARARDLLRSRLVRRGLTPAVGGLPLALSRESSAALHRELLDRTVTSSLKLALGSGTGQIVSASITSLVEGVLTSMFLNTVKSAGAALVVCGLAFAGVGVMARQGARPTKKEAPPAVKSGAEVVAPKIPARPREEAVREWEHVYAMLAQANAQVKEGRGNDSKSQQILGRLEEPISMSFAEDTPLEDVLKYVKQATTTKTYSGIQIYVDPVSLQEAEKSMTSTVRNMDLEGVPLRRTLQILLKQLDLVYFVDDGVLCITSAAADSRYGFGPAIPEPPPIMQRAQKAERGELSLSEMKELIEVFKSREQIRKLASGESVPSHDTTAGTKQIEEARQSHEQMSELLKEMRELIRLLKAEKQAKKTAEVK